MIALVLVIILSMEEYHAALLVNKLSTNPTVEYGRK